MAPICSLPNEILSSVLAQLGTCDVLRCAQVGRQFRDLINHDALLQYKAELTIHGMANVPQEDIPVAMKLSALKLYGERFHSGMFDCAALQKPGLDADRSFTSFLSPDGSIVHFARSQGSGTRCVVDQLPSATRGIQACRWTAPLPGVTNMDVLAFDLSQNLTVAVEHRNDREVLIHFLTATEGQPHPLAAKPVLDATAVSRYVDGLDAYYHVQSVHISGTNVGWVIPGFSSGLDTLQCWSWQTGRLIWEQQCDGLAGYTFLDARYVLTAIHQGKGAMLCIHDLRTTDDDSTTPGPVCSLGLPGASTGDVQVVHVQSRTPTHPRDAAVPFVRDPMSTAVVLQLTICPGAEGETSDLILMVPHRTLHGLINEAISSGCGIQSKYVFEWDKWGPGGAVMLSLPRKAESGGWFMPPDVWPQSFGSRLALLFCDSGDTASGCVVTVDVDPWAAKCARRNSGHQSGSHSAQRDIPHQLAAMPKHLASLPTHLPHAVQVGPKIVLPPGQRPSRIITTHDGFAIAFAGDDPEVGLQVFSV